MALCQQSAHVECADTHSSQVLAVLLELTVFFFRVELPKEVECHHCVQVDYHGHEYDCEYELRVE